MSAGFLCFLWRYRIIDVDPCVTQELGSLLVGNNNKFTVVQTCLKGDRLDSNCKIVRCFHFSRFVCFHQMKITWKPDITGSHFAATGSNVQPRSWGARGSGFAESRRELQLAHVGALGSEDARHNSSEKNRKRTSWAWWIYKLKWPILMIYIWNMVL